MDEGEGGYGESGDPMDQFHRNEAISAVADDGFLAEEDDDYEDLYNDVNVGEGFLQSLRKTEDSSGFRNNDDDVDDKKQQLPPPPPPPPPAHDSIPAVVGGGGSGEGVGGVVEPRVSGFQNQAFRGNEVGVTGGGGGGGGGIRVELGPKSAKLSEIDEQQGGGSDGVGVQGIGQQQPHVVGSVGNEGLVRQQGQGGGVIGGGGNLLNRVGGHGIGNSGGVVSNVNVTAGGNGGGAGAGAGTGGGATILFVGDLHWWTTDAELEAELCKYGQVKEVKFYDEKASGKSKGYCQVEFYDPASATACKEGMNGYLFNGRPCVVAYASPFTVKKMGEAQNNRNQPVNQTATNPGRRGPPEAGAKPGGSNVGTGGNFQGGDGNNRGFGRGNWGRGNNPGMGNRGPVNPMRNRGGGMGGRGIMGNGGNGFGQGMGATPPMMHHQSMMNQGFDPAFGGPMGRMGGYGGFPGAPGPPFSGMLPSFPGVGGVGLPGVAPHVNPAFFGRGMPMNGMGMMPASGVDGPNMGMWADPNMGGWGGDEHGGGKAGESSYGEEAASDQQYGDDRAGWSNAVREKDRGSERDWSGTSERRYKDDRDQGYERDAPREKDVGHDNEWSERVHRDDREVGRERSRDRDQERSRDRDRDRERDRGRSRDREREKYREDRDRYADHHRYRDREAEHDDEWERGRSSRNRSKSRLPHEDEHHSRRDADYGKRRRLTSE